MAVKYNILEYTVNVLVEKLMNTRKCSYDTALETVMRSAVYARLLTDEHFLEEGDIFLFKALEKELAI